MIPVRPDRLLRVEFARWAVAQTPKIRTVSTDTFAVPPHLYPEIPEHLLVGAVVEGEVYVPVASVAADTDPDDPDPGPNDVHGDVSASTTPSGIVPVTSADSGPDRPDSDPDPRADTADVPTPAEEPVEAPGSPVDDLQCPDCTRSFSTLAGLSSHRRHAHPQEG
ncbi:hypothetical protein [Streptomyces chilikensis]|uniref:C2H2-type domain-containing protein n=1 Tax=Streptomyces chilikensis TaxID=1194079 RepID=A0ABV3EJG4_9ACTN